MADSTKARLKKAQIDVDHYQRLGEGMTQEQMFDVAADAVRTSPGNKTVNRGSKKATKFKRGGMVKGGRDYCK